MAENAATVDGMTAQQWKDVYISAVQQHQNELKRIHQKQVRDNHLDTYFAVRTVEGFIYGRFEYYKDASDWLFTKSIENDAFIGAELVCFRATALQEVAPSLEDYHE